MKPTKRGRQVISFLLACLLLVLATLGVHAEATPISTESVGTESAAMELPCRSAVLMDAKTGQILFEQNGGEALPPASVTKIMTLLLVMEAIDSGSISLSDMVSVSANAASMGGSQVYLKEGESMSVEEMLKCVVIASANDCAVALAEYVAGSEEQFVAKMNARAAELGMTATNFENTNGLDDTATNHVTSAMDIAIMSRALIAHEKILEYSGIWMDTVRDGAFGLTNTNRLVRFYRGCTGLKTGSTAKAKFCISATAERDGLSLICVIMAAESRDVRNQAAAKLLDFGFATYSSFEAEGGEGSVPVRGGVLSACRYTYGAFAHTVAKGSAARVEKSIELADTLIAPVEAGAEIGRVVYRLAGEEIGSVPILAAESVGKISFGVLFYRILQQFLLL